MTYAAAELDVAPGHAIAAVVADRFAARDAARMAEITAALRCRYCRAWVHDRVLKTHPGVCGDPECVRRWRREEPQRPARADEAPAASAPSAAGLQLVTSVPEETPMEPAARRCDCGRQIRTTKDGARHEKCATCRGTSRSAKPKVANGVAGDHVRIDVPPPPRTGPALTRARSTTRTSRPASPRPACA